MKEARKKSSGERGRARPYVFNITNYEAYAYCVKEVTKENGKIDTLVNNAAISFYGNIFEDSVEQWRETQQINLEAIYWGSKLVVPYMAKQRWGRIISISSIATEGRVEA